MNIAITVWEDRISPVFDSGRTLLIAEIRDNAVVRTSYLPFDFDRPLELLRLLRAEKVKIIISGAISQGQANMLLYEGFELISFVAGDVRRVLETFVKGGTLGEDFRMPGCDKNICCRGKIRRGRGLSNFDDNHRRGKGPQRQSTLAVPEISNGNNDSATSTEMSVRLSEKL
jgi:predicted Fe-Mo cluster-binding NifX family protein